MKKLNLNGKWILNYKDEHIPATVPGSLYHDLLVAGKMEDPFWRDNEDKVRPITDAGAVYYRTFDLSKDMLDADSVILHCDGLDTLADIYVNGVLIGSAENQHRIWEYPLDNLQEGENTISITFHSPVDYIRAKSAEVYADGTPDGMVGYPHIRKAHCMFGWDWGPRLPDLGIWRDISIISINKARLNSVYVTQNHSDGEVCLAFAPEIETFKKECTDGLSVKYTIIAPNGEVLGSQISDSPFKISNPELWWPNGYGDQPLYTIIAELFDGDILCDTWERRIGLRTMTISRDKDEWGEEFCYLVNGHKIFAMGADYIPEDNIFPRMNKERTRQLLEDCVLANMNSVRIWGGGFYPDNYFYDICDELGLIVWQDFMFCCAMYELTLDFEDNIRRELEDNVRRLRHHASLGLWCGNNEMEWHIKIGVWKYSPSQYSAYFRMYEHIFPEICRKLDPQTFYWPASPSSGGGFDEPNDPNRGDVHYWSVWHGLKPFSDYRNYFFRFVSEFGFQSLPLMKTIESFTLPEDRNMFSYVMEKHQRNGAANGKIVYYLAQMFLYPHSFETLVYASQLLQAEAIKYGVEHWRRNRERCMGAIYWQLNDCWPVASWASIDYFGRWKALHYFAKRFFAPIMLSAEEEGVITQNTNINAEHWNINKSVRLSVANETRQEFNGTVKWALRDNYANILQEGEQAVVVAPLTSLWLDEMKFDDAVLFEHYVSYDLYDTEGNYVSGGTVLFCMPKQYKFMDPQLTYTIEGDIITITSKAYVKSVEIDCKENDILLSDNYFDMNSGSVSVKILRGEAKDINIRSVYDIK